MNLKIIEKSIYYLFAFLPIFLTFGTLLSELSIILICILFLFYSYKTNNFSWINNEDAKILLLLYFFLIINFIFSSDKSLSLLRDIGFIKYIIFIFAVKNLLLNKIDIIKKIINIWSIFFLIVVIDLYFEYFFGKNILGFYSENPSRLVGFLGDEYKVHVLENMYSYVHIDSTIALLREGLCLLNPERVNDDNMPEILKSWDKIWCPPCVDIGYYGNFNHASTWIGLNLLSIDENTVIVDESQVELHKLLKKHNVDSLPLRIRHSRTLGGSFHCVTTDIHRQS